MVDETNLIFPAAFGIALIFWLILWMLITKVLDIIERKRKDRRDATIRRRA